MAVVDRRKIENVRYLFGSPSTVKSRYNQLKRTFPEGKEYLIFAEPVFVEDTNSVLWSSEHKGSIINFQKLSPTDQSIAKRLLTSSIQTLLAAAKQFDTDELTEFIYNCIEIPSMNNVFLVRGNGVDNVVLSEWGFVSDVPGMEKGLLAKIINIKRVDMNFDVVFEDKDPAPNQKFYFEFEDQKQTHISDADAKIKLLEVREDEEVKAYQKDGDEIVNEQSFVCYDAGRYTLEAIHRIDMEFKVLNSNDVPVAGQTFIFDYKGEVKTLVSDSEGKIILPEVKVGDEVVVYQKKEEEQYNDHNFICNKDNENILRIVEEEICDIKFKVVNSSGEVVQAQAFTIEYAGETKVLTSDAEGKIVLSQVKPGGEVVAYQIKDEKRINEHKFTAQCELENLLKLEDDPIFNMRFKVIDNKGRIVPNATVKIKYNGKTVEKITDEEGYAILEDVDPQTQVKVIAIGKKQKKQK